MRQWRCCAVSVCWPCHAIGTCEMPLRCLGSHVRPPFCCWQPAIDCRPSAGCNSEPMALLRRLLALSCDRHMRNATAVSALICGVCEGGCSCWSLERKAASSVCWQPCDRHMRIGTCEMPLRSRLCALLALICGVCEGGCSCWSLERKAASSVLRSTALISMRHVRGRGGCLAKHCGLGSHMRHVRGRRRRRCAGSMRNATAVWAVSRAKGCVVGVLAATNRL